MPRQRDENKAFLGWWAPSALRERLEALIERQGGTKTDALSKALADYLDREENREGPRNGRPA